MPRHIADGAARPARPALNAACSAGPTTESFHVRIDAVPVARAAEELARVDRAGQVAAVAHQARAAHGAEARREPRTLDRSGGGPHQRIRFGARAADRVVLNVGPGRGAFAEIAEREPRVLGIRHAVVRAVVLHGVKRAADGAGDRGGVVVVARRRERCEVGAEVGPELPDPQRGLIGGLAGGLVVVDLGVGAGVVPLALVGVVVLRRDPGAQVLRQAGGLATRLSHIGVGAWLERERWRRDSKGHTCRHHRDSSVHVAAPSHDTCHRAASSDQRLTPATDGAG